MYSAEKRLQLLDLGRVGLCPADIAAALGMDEKEVSGEPELPRVIALGNGEILTSLFKMATSGSNTSAAIFLAKLRCFARNGKDDVSPRSDNNSPEPSAPEPFEFRVELDNEAPNDGV